MNPSPEFLQVPGVAYVLYMVCKADNKSGCIISGNEFPDNDPMQRIRNFFNSHGGERRIVNGPVVIVHVQGKLDIQFISGKIFCCIQSKQLFASGNLSWCSG